MWWCVDGLSSHPVSTVPTFADCKLFKASNVAFLRSQLLVGTCSVSTSTGRDATAGVLVSRGRGVGGGAASHDPAMF